MNLLSNGEEQKTNMEDDTHFSRPVFDRHSSEMMIHGIEELKLKDTIKNLKTFNNDEFEVILAKIVQKGDALDAMFEIQTQTGSEKSKKEIQIGNARLKYIQENQSALKQNRFNKNKSSCLFSWMICSSKK